MDSSDLKIYDIFTEKQSKTVFPFFVQTSLGIILGIWANVMHFYMEGMTLCIASE